MKKKETERPENKCIDEKFRDVEVDSRSNNSCVRKNGIALVRIVIGPSEKNRNEHKLLDTRIRKESVGG
jgi:hypothetical protein